MARVIRFDEPVALGHQLLESLAEGRADRRIIGGRGNVVRREFWIDQAAAVEIEDDQRRDFVAVDACDHDIAHQRRAGGDEARAQRTDAETQVPLASLKSSAMRPSKSKPASKSLASAGLMASPNL